MGYFWLPSSCRGIVPASPEGSASPGWVSHLSEQCCACPALAHGISGQQGGRGWQSGKASLFWESQKKP